MIREFRIEDIELIKKLLSLELDEEQCDSMIESLKLSNLVLVYEESDVLGLIYATQYDKIKNEWEFSIYVHPLFRNKGIGSQLYQTLNDYLVEQKVSKIRVIMDSKNEDLKRFIEKQDFHKWYGTNGFKYDGPHYPNVELPFIPFDMSYFDQYAELGAACFYEVRKENNIKPYGIQPNENYKNYVLSIKDKLYMLVSQDNEIIATFSIDGQSIDHVLVSPKHQGKKLGKAVTMYAVNKLIDQGVHTIYLSCLEKNPKATNLYLSLGFKIVETSEVYVKEQLS